MSRILPPIFLLVAAFLVNMTLSRLVALEREQIGLLKAMGYGSWAVARHYMEFVLLIAVAGIIIGFVAGAWLGTGITTLYAKFFSFPFLVFSRNPAVYAIAGGRDGGGRAGRCDTRRREPSPGCRPPRPWPRPHRRGTARSFAATSI